MYIKNIAAMTNVPFEIIGVTMLASPVDTTCSHFNFDAMNEGASHIYFRDNRCTRRSIKKHDRLLLSGYIYGEIRHHPRRIERPAPLGRGLVEVMGIAL